MNIKGNRLTFDAMLKFVFTIVVVILVFVVIASVAIWVLARDFEYLTLALLLSVFIFAISDARKVNLLMTRAQLRKSIVITSLCLLAPIASWFIISNDMIISYVLLVAACLAFILCVEIICLRRMPNQQRTEDNINAN